MRLVNSITDSMHMKLSKLQEMVNRGTYILYYLWNMIIVKGKEGSGMRNKIFEEMRE